ncbi:MAG: alpha/beta hydrolase [Alphaproteobacteria bacterium]|nr:alpha/beta hydrolase [Alphaproteobacteria bacterium]
MPTISDQGVELWYEVSGKGPPLVLTGGFGLLHNQFDEVRALLSESFTVIDWNYRGCGRSDRAWTGAYTLERWVDDLKLILDHLKIDRPSLWATSTGARIGIRYAARFPDRVAKLLTYPTFKLARTGAGNRDLFADIGETYGYEALGRMFQWLGAAEHHVFSERGNRMAQFEAGCFAQNFSIPTMRLILATFSSTDLSSDVARLKCPAALLVGASGRLGAKATATAESISDFQRLKPGTPLITVENGGGTYCMIEEPYATAAAAIGWLKA